MNNFGLKILAVLFAVVLWIVVVNIDDPSNSKPYTTSVSLENKSYTMCRAIRLRRHRM